MGETTQPVKTLVCVVFPVALELCHSDVIRVISARTWRIQTTESLRYKLGTKGVSTLCHKTDLTSSSFVTLCEMV